MGQWQYVVFSHNFFVCYMTLELSCQLQSELIVLFSPDSFSPYSSVDWALTINTIPSAYVPGKITSPSFRSCMVSLDRGTYLWALIFKRKDLFLFQRVTERTVVIFNPLFHSLNGHCFPKPVAGSWSGSGAAGTGICLYAVWGVQVTADGLLQFTAVMCNLTFRYS